MPPAPGGGLPQAVRALQERIETLQIRCGLAERSTIYLPGNILGTNQLKLEAAARQKLGLRSEFIGRQHLHDLTGMDKPGAILSQGNGEADPVRLVAGLWRHFLARGGRMVANVEVTEVEQTRSRVRLKTKDGHSITAKYAVFCTGYELMKFARPKGYKIISTWALATRPQPDRIWPSKSLIWEAADPYLYMRTTGQGRVIVGGEDESFSDDVLRDKLIPKKIAAIARKAKRIFPNIDFTRRLCLDRQFWRKPNGASSHWPCPGTAALLCRAGFWWKRHYLQHARRTTDLPPHAGDKRSRRGDLQTLGWVIDTTVPLSPVLMSTWASSCWASALTSVVPRPVDFLSGFSGMPPPLSDTDRVHSAPLTL